MHSTSKANALTMDNKYRYSPACTFTKCMYIDTLIVSESQTIAVH